MTSMIRADDMDAEARHDANTLALLEIQLTNNGRLNFGFDVSFGRFGGYSQAAFQQMHRDLLQQAFSFGRQSLEIVGSIGSSAACGDNPGLAAGCTYRDVETAARRGEVSADEFAEFQSNYLTGISIAASGGPSTALFRGAGAAIFRVFGAARTTTAVVRVGDRLTTVFDVLKNPSLLAGKSPAEINMILGRTAGWRTETLGRGSHAGQGYVLREYTAAGNPTGRMIQWHPGGGHHGPNPYWRVRSGEGGVSPIIPGGP